MPTQLEFLPSGVENGERRHYKYGDRDLDVDVYQKLTNTFFYFSVQ